MSKRTGKKEFAMNDDYQLEDPLADILEALEESVVPDPAQQLGDLLVKNTGGPSAPLSKQAAQIVRELSGMKLAPNPVYLLSLYQLEPYPDQPFKIYPPDKLEELAEDIGRVGILNPILARKHKSKYQILAGHNRWAAAALAGLSEVPVMILDADDDLAALVVTSTNLRQREKLAPSEKAFAYKMQMEALKRQGQRSGKQYNAASFITDQTGDSRMQIHRYVRLTELEPGLLELLDKGRISMTPAVALSHLTAEDQRAVLRCLRELGGSLTIERANTLKEMALKMDGESLGRAEIDAVLLQTARKERRVAGTVRLDNIRRYLPEGVGDDEAERVIIEALQAWRDKL